MLLFNGDSLDNTKRQILISVLDTAKKYSTEATEEMPYGVPSLKLKGKPLIAVAPHKDYFGVFPFSPSVIEKARLLIGNHETAKGTIRFKYGTLPTEELIKKLLELRSQEII